MEKRQKGPGLHSCIKKRGRACILAFRSKELSMLLLVSKMQECRPGPFS